MVTVPELSVMSISKMLEETVTLFSNTVLVLTWSTWTVTVTLPLEVMAPKSQFTNLHSLGDEKLQPSSRLTCGGLDDAFRRSSASRV